MGKVVSHIEVDDDGNVFVEVEHTGIIVAKMSAYEGGPTFFDEAQCIEDEFEHPCADIVTCNHAWEWKEIPVQRFAYWVS